MMVREFQLSPKIIQKEKTSLVTGTLFLVATIILGIIEISQNQASSMKIYCLIPWAILLEILSIAHSYHSINQKKLITSPNGIEYRAFSHTVFSKWDELKKIGKDPALLGRKIDYIITASKDIKDRGPLIKLYSSERKNYIPISIFAENWRDSELGQQIKQYAPHLFEKEKSA